MSVTLWLVRHGATEWSAEGRFCSHTDVPLSPIGEEQARALRERVRGRAFAGVWASDMRRAADTARIAYGEPTIDARLRELDFGAFEGRRWADCNDEERARMLEFDAFVAPEGEAVSRLAARLSEFVGELPDGDHLVFTHGGPIRVFLRSGPGDGMVAPGELQVVSAPDRL